MSEFVCARIEIEETAATIGAERKYLSQAVGAIRTARLEIERQIRRDQFFLTSMEPYEPQPDSGRVIHRMCKASAAAGVGPMAAVAGTIAQEALEAMVGAGCAHGWVDNGGDVALVLDEPITMEIFSDPAKNTAYALELPATEVPKGVCTSSGTLGHSISFGNADAVVVMAEDAVLADALATAVGNRVKSAADLATCFDDFRATSGFLGGVAMCSGSVSTFGRVPRIIEVEHSPERLTVHSKMSSKRYVGTNAEQPEVRA